MGNSQSSFTVESSCNQISNDEVVYFTKQYFTIDKMIDILLDLENGTKTNLSPAAFYMVDLYKAIPDIVNGTPMDISIELFDPKLKFAEIKNGEPIEVLYTVFHKYNDFVLKETPLLDDSKLKERAKVIREELVDISQRLIEFIGQYCTDVGVFYED